MCYSKNMADFSFQQKQKQAQVQVLTQKQLQSINLLSYSAESLREEIYKVAQENPALIIKKDNIAGSSKTSTNISASGQLASDNFLAVIESTPDERKSLTEHLLEQFNVLKLNPSEQKLGHSLIYNLNDEGFYILAPDSLLDKNDLQETPEMLEKVIKIIQSLDPCGCCCANTFESLYIQAKQKENCPELALFLLDGHYKDFLDTTKPEKILRKIIYYKTQREKLFGDTEFTQKYPNLILTENEIEKAIKFIQTLEPYPARNFTTKATHYVSPDVYVEKLDNAFPKETKDDFSRGIVCTEHAVYKIHTAKDEEVEPQINPEFEHLLKDKNFSQQDKSKIEKKINEAKEFIDSLNFRQNTILLATEQIVKLQSEFFLKGPGNLKPLKQADLAKKLNVHETTISRMANSKYLNCEWGLFEIKYFFSNAISRTTSLTQSEVQEKARNAGTSENVLQSSDSVSRDNVLFQIKKILSEHQNDKKNLSDQNLSDILAERGIKIARRTVAKYRKLLNIESSYER